MRTLLRRWLLTLLVLMVSTSAAVATGRTALPTTLAMVQLAVPTLPEGNVALASDVAAQRRTIKSTQDALLAHLAGTPYRVVRRFQTIPFLTLEVTPETRAILRQSREVAHVLDDSPVFPTLIDSVKIVQADEAWAAGYDGTGWTVAVIDTGIDTSHPFLSGAVVAEACFIQSSSCPNGQTSQIGPGAGAPCPFALDCRHGTHVAGIIAGGGLGSAAAGVAKGAQLLSIRVFSSTAVSASATVSDVVSALEHVFLMRNSFSIAAVNMSLNVQVGYASQRDCDNAFPQFKAAIDNLRSVGIATVVSAGNAGSTQVLNAPACISSAISVGATDKADQVANFSDSAPFLSLLAPGVAITSSVPGGDFEAMSGTSMAAPHVAGAWAITKEFSPTASIDRILTALQTSGRVIVDPRNGVRIPRIQVFSALRYLTSPSQQPHLHVAINGNGTVGGSGISCPSVCEADYSRGALVTLTAGPASGWRFAGWNGACSGQVNPCILTLSDDASVAANFVPAQPTRKALAIAITGSGSVSGQGIDCPRTCNADYPNGTRVSLTATPVSGWRFTSWGGACKGQGNPCAVTMNDNLSVSATFVAVAATAQLNVSVSGSGQVTGPGIRCPGDPSDCSEDFTSGTMVTLTATPGPPQGALLWRFHSWGGVCEGQSNPCTLTLAGTRSVTANFSAFSPPPSPVRAVDVVVAGNGTVTSTPPGIQCRSAQQVDPAGCVEPYLPGTVVTLLATPDSTDRFNGWTGACAAQANPCTLTMDTNKSVGARFDTSLAAPSPIYTLNVSVAGRGTVTSTPSGIQCHATQEIDPVECAEPYLAGTQVTLTAASDSAGQFYGWTGACAGQGNPCNLTMTSNMSTTSVLSSPDDVLITGLRVQTSSPTRLGEATTFAAAIGTGTDVQYLWNFGDGTTGADPTTAHTYAASGSYTVVVMASNGHGLALASTIVQIFITDERRPSLFLPLLQR